MIKQRSGRPKNGVSIFGRDKRFFAPPTASRQALKPGQPSPQWVPGVLFPRLKRSERGADHSSQSSTAVKNNSSPPYIFTACYLYKHKDLPLLGYDAVHSGTCERFGGTCCLHLQEKRLSYVRVQMVKTETTEHCDRGYE